MYMYFHITKMPVVCIQSNSISPLLLMCLCVTIQCASLPVENQTPKHPMPFISCFQCTELVNSFKYLLMSCWTQFPSCLMIRFIFSPSLPFVCPCRNNCYTYWRGSPYSFVINYYSTHRGTKKCIVLSGFKYLWMFLKKEIWQSEADTLTHPTVCGPGLNYSSDCHKLQWLGVWSEKLINYRGNES